MNIRIAILRGINVGRERKILMADLKSMCEKLGFDVPVIVRTEKEHEASINNNPFFDKDADIKQLHLTFLKEKPSKENIDKTLTYNYEPDKFKIDDKDTFIFCQGNITNQN
jgi:uncharacterized protein (DUF1697 family)